MNTILRSAALALALAAAPSASAIDWAALFKDAAISDFDDEDVRQYLDALRSMLDAPLPAPPLDWRNERTGAGAHIETLGQVQVENFDECRRMRTTVYSKRNKGQPFVWTACRDEGGRWRLVSAK
ncbi:MAG TPA: RT0821/Lpp0805 family surface protein [Steroidobacter sp.]|nr:RT0821/Lpp0805 family surface protein [Steroidobacter sp.]